MSKIAASILSCDFSDIGTEIAKVEKAGADMIHIDVMDGHFVPNITIGPPVIEKLRKVTQLPFDVHLMIENPHAYVDIFADAGADGITFHVEAVKHHDRLLHKIKKLGKKAGVALNPSTPLFFLDHIYEYLDLILVMTVNPGFGGQEFIEGSYHKVRVLKKKMERHGFDIPIQVDGGVTLENIAKIADAGASIFVAGSAIFNTSDYEQTVKEMKSRITKTDD